MMTATQCPSHHRLHAYSCGRLPDDDSHAIYEHLQDCLDCQSELNAVNGDDDSLIVDLRADDHYAGFADEPDCKRALAKALGALARAGETDGSLPPPTDFPKHLGEYEIVREIGHGGMGRVFLARQTKLGRQVALKVIADHRLTDPKTRDRFDAEMRAVGRLSHPNIVTAHDAREVDGLAVLVTEFIDGKNLQQIVKQTGPLSLSNAADVVTKVAAALQYTSEQGFVHRDVKPSNIMISRSGEVKLLDLGLARFHLSPGAELTASGQTIGTADYVAPEQVANAHDADSRSDVYSLGCTLFQLLTGVAPFESEQYSTSFAKLTAHVSAAPPNLKTQLPGCPNEIARLVDAMLEKSPDRRPQTPGEVAKTLPRFAIGSDLQKLVRRADESLPSTRPGSLSTAATPQPWLRHPVPRSLAIACGFFGILFGLMLGMFIKIKYPDGTEVLLPLTPGSSVEVLSDDDGNGTAPNPVAPQARQGAKVQPGVDAVRRGLNSAEKLIEQLQGIWQITPQINDTPKSEKTVLAYFDGFQFCIVTVGNEIPDLSYGVFATQHDSRDTSIRLDFEPQAITVVLKQLTPQNVEQSFSARAFLVHAFPVKIDSDVMGLTKEQAIRPNLMSFERVGSFPKSQADMQLLLGDHTLNPRDPYIKALTILTQAHVMGPKQMQKATNKANAASRVVRSQNNMKQIGIAFHHFNDAYHRFPGSINVLEGSVSTNGKTIHPFSWRVAILPFIEQQELFESYRFTEPWDSKHNLKLLDKMPEIYRSPRAPDDQPKGHTNYLGLTTKSALMEKEGGTKLRDITDGAANTILIVESKKTVPWTAPQDLSEYPDFFSPAIFAMADASVKSEAKPDREQIQEMITIDGGK